MNNLLIATTFVTELKCAGLALLAFSALMAAYWCYGKPFFFVKKRSKN